MRRDPGIVLCFAHFMPPVSKAGSTVLIVHCNEYNLLPHFSPPSDWLSPENALIGTKLRLSQGRMINGLSTSGMQNMSTLPAFHPFLSLFVTLYRRCIPLHPSSSTISSDRFSHDCRRQCRECSSMPHTQPRRCRRMRRRRVARRQRRLRRCPRRRCCDGWRSMARATWGV